MSLSRIIVFLLINVVFQGTSCTNSMLRQVSKNEYTRLPSLMASSQHPLKFKTKLKIYEVSLSGILVAKKIRDEYRISFINEFGVKYFDACISEAEIKMIYCIKQLDKRVFTNVLLHDLAILLLPSSVGDASGNIYPIENYTYHYTRNEGTAEHIQEYKRNKIATVFSRTTDGEISVEHKRFPMSLNLKPI